MHLPVQTVLPQLEQALTHHSAAVLVAPPGSGKTTLVPLALHKASWLNGKKIIVLEPRRIAARLAAKYMSRQLGEKVGSTVGYQVRFDKHISPDTKIEVITEGLLTRRLQSDPELADAGLVIFDEFHERSLDSDLAFALCLDILGSLRDDLRLLVMSATMDSGPVSKLLGDAPVITGEGRMYPVTIEHLPPLPQFDSHWPKDIAQATTRAIRQILSRHQGDMLVFLPGIGEINRVQQQLSGENISGKHYKNRVVHPLHGGLKPAEQEMAIRPDAAGRQRIILATTIAETSVTIEGITVVIDCGWKRIPRFDANSGLSRLDTVRISRASAKQRAGRAGRLGPGACYRLWNMGVDAGLQAFDLPEIRQADLAPLALELANWGVNNPDQLSWLDLPPESSFEQAKELLTTLGALDRAGLITKLGRQMTSLPLHPRLTRMVCLGGRQNKKISVDLAALLSERDLLPQSESADIENRLYCLQLFRSQGMAAVRSMGANPGGCARALQVSRQLNLIVKTKSLPSSPSMSVGALLALAYPDRIAKRRTSTKGYKLVSGKGASLVSHDPMKSREWLVVASQNMHSRDGRIFLAAAITVSEIENIFQHELVEKNECFWHGTTNAVVSRKNISLGKLIITEKKSLNPDPDTVQKALIIGMRELGLTVLPFTPDARFIQARVCCLR